MALPFWEVFENIVAVAVLGAVITPHESPKSPIPS